MVRYTSRSIKEALLYAVYIKDEDMKQAMFAQQQKFVKADPRTKTFSWLLVMYLLELVRLMLKDNFHWVYYYRNLGADCTRSGWNYLPHLVCKRARTGYADRLWHHAVWHNSSLAQYSLE